MADVEVLVMERLKMFWAAVPEVVELFVSNVGGCCLVLE